MPLAYLLVWAAAWTVTPLLIHLAPPGDNLEQLDWVQHLAFGYSKHPPLPTWLLWIFGEFLPRNVELTYVLGALEVLAMLACAAYIGRRLLDPARAWLAVLLATFITYYTLRMHYYNHNTLLLAATAAALAALVAALERDHALCWLLLGAAWGAGMLAKYEMAIGIACNLAAILTSDLTWPRRLRAIGLASLAALLLFLRHFVWLVDNHFPPLQYAAKFVGARLAIPARLDRVLSFSADQMLRLLPMLALLAILLWIARRQHAKVPTISKNGDSTVQRRHERLLAIHALGPMGLIAFLGLAIGADLEMHWGTAYLWAIPLWLLARQGPSKIALVRSKTVLQVACVVQTLMLVGFVFYNTL